MGQKSSAVPQGQLRQTDKKSTNHFILSAFVSIQQVLNEDCCFSFASFIGPRKDLLKHGKYTGFPTLGVETQTMECPDVERSSGGLQNLPN